MPHIAKNISSFSKSEVKQFFKSARCVLRNPGLTVLYNPSTNSFGRVLVVTARKVGTSPERNLIRRRIKAIFYENALYEKKYDVVFLIRKPAVSLSFDELKACVLKATSNLPPLPS